MFTTRTFNDSCKPNVTKQGFTLFELLIVIFIISLMSAIVMPSLWNSGERDLKSEAKRISNTLRFVYDEVAGKKQTYRLKFDLDTNSWSYEGNNEIRKFKMKDNVMFMDIIIPSSGITMAGELIIEFSPAGPAEPVTVHITNNRDEYTVVFNHITGRSKVSRGYIR